MLGGSFALVTEWFMKRFSDMLRCTFETLQARPKSNIAWHDSYCLQVDTSGNKALYDSWDPIPWEISSKCLGIQQRGRGGRGANWRRGPNVANQCVAHDGGISQPHLWVVAVAVAAACRYCSSSNDNDDAGWLHIFIPFEPVHSQHPEAFRGLSKTPNPFFPRKQFIKWKVTCCLSNGKSHVVFLASCRFWVNYILYILYTDIHYYCVSSDIA